MDLKEGKYKSKQEFLDKLKEFPATPWSIVDSGNGIHVYWRVTGLEPMTYLKIQRRLYRHLNTDPAVCCLKQLMRLPNTYNTKKPDNLILCEVLSSSECEYTTEQMDKILPKLLPEDLEYCEDHYNSTYGVETEKYKIDLNKLSSKFNAILADSEEARRLFYGPVKDRSAADYRLCHLLHAQGIDKEEAIAILSLTNKALERNEKNRLAYAKNIVKKIYVDESELPAKPILARSITEILKQSLDAPKNIRIPCNRLVDATDSGYRLTEVLGLIGGQGNGKTSTGLNFFKWFIERNPQYIHVFVSLEQPKNEIAARWTKLTSGDSRLDSKVLVIDNYNEDGTYRELSLSQIEKEIKTIEATTQQKVGCVVIDHIGILKQEKTRKGENEGLIGVCKQLKAFAVATNTFLVIQSQTSREKNKNGEVELDIDAAYGTSNFENYCDYIMTLWQPLKRVYHKAPHMKLTAFKYCKIRNYNPDKDEIKRDLVYVLNYDVDKGELTQPSEQQLKEFAYWHKLCIQERTQDKKNKQYEPEPFTYNLEDKKDAAS